MNIDDWRYEIKLELRRIFFILKVLRIVHCNNCKPWYSIVLICSIMRTIYAGMCIKWFANSTKSLAKAKAVKWKGCVGLSCVHAFFCVRDQPHILNESFVSVISSPHRFIQGLIINGLIVIFEEKTKSVNWFWKMSNEWKQWIWTFQKFCRPRLIVLKYTFTDCLHIEQKKQMKWSFCMSFHVTLSNHSLLVAV